MRSPSSIKAKTAILDGEIVALDDQGRPSFSLMQQRTGLRRTAGEPRRAGDCPSFITFLIFSMWTATTCVA